MPHANGTVTHTHLTALDAEREVLGAALLDEVACAKAIEMLEPDHFAGRSDAHHHIFATMQKLFSQGEEVNLATVTDAGGHDATYLTDLTNAIGTTGNVEYHGRIIVERWMARSAVRRLKKTAKSLESGGDVFDALRSVQTDLSDLQVGHTGDTHISAAVEDALRRASEWESGTATDVVPTGIYGLDRAIGGYPVGELTTLAAQTGAGKTSLIVQIIRTLALAWSGSDKGAALLFSAEMSAEQIAHRAASGMASWRNADGRPQPGVDIRRLRSGKATEAEYRAYDEALARIAELEWHVDAEPTPSFAHIQARCQQVQQTSGLAFVAVDYDEKIHSEGQTEELRVASIAKGLKNLAKRFEVPVVTLSQYSRKASGNYGYPENGWLRYSGKKEQESALILHWYWPGYFTKKGAEPEDVKNYDPSHPGKGWMLCTKNRFGPEGNCILHFQPQWTRFRDPEDPEQRNDPF